MLATRCSSSSNVAVALSAFFILRTCVLLPARSDEDEGFSAELLIRDLMGRLREGIPRFTSSEL